MSVYDMATKKYDSKNDTLMHKTNLYNIITMLFLPELFNRARTHDDSKLKEPEKSLYDEFIPKLRTAKYGTPEYESIREEMRKKGGDHHNSVNRHHPEFFTNGISGMTLIDFNEMICDWFAASLRSDTTFIDGLDRNIEKYNIPPMMAQIIINTYYAYFKDFEDFVKSEDAAVKKENLYKEYKLMAYESCQKGLYDEGTRDWILNNLYDIMHSPNK